MTDGFFWTGIPLWDGYPSSSRILILQMAHSQIFSGVSSADLFVLLCTTNIITVYRIPLKQKHVITGRPNLKGARVEDHVEPTTSNSTLPSASSPPHQLQILPFRGGAISPCLWVCISITSSSAT
jgi:hypothetical protein